MLGPVCCLLYSSSRLQKSSNVFVVGMSATDPPANRRARSLRPELAGFHGCCEKVEKLLGATGIGVGLSAHTRNETVLGFIERRDAGREVERFVSMARAQALSARALVGEHDHCQSAIDVPVVC